MKSSVTNILIALGLIVIGLGIAAAGIYVGETDDAPGAAGHPAHDRRGDARREDRTA